MSNFLAFVIIFIMGFGFLNAQNYAFLNILILDKDNNAPISNATVSIKETGYTSKVSNSNGRVFFEESVPIGEIKYLIVKEGYQGLEGNFNITTEEKSNTLIIKLSKLSKDKLLIFGKVLDLNDIGTANAVVEVRLADIYKKTISDKSGNYSLELDLNSEYNLDVIRLEARCPDGEGRVTDEIGLTRNNNFYKDFKLNCPNTEKGLIDSKTEELSKFERDDLLVELIGCKQSGIDIICDLKFTSRSVDSYFGSWFYYNHMPTRIIDEAGNEYSIRNMKLANVSNKSYEGFVNKQLIADFPVIGSYTFTGASRDVGMLASLDIYSWYRDTKNYFYISFRKVKVK